MKVIRDVDNQLITQSEDLDKKILHLRTEMDLLAKIYGISHELTVAKSQELDLLLNEFMMPKSKTNLDIKFLKCCYK